MENLTKQFNVKLSPQQLQQLNELVEYMQAETPSQVLRRLIREAHDKCSNQKIEEARTEQRSSMSTKELINDILRQS